ncbi:hypothetical protein [Vibrio nitrifigilis]|uniref:Uncharacterized protein n=1 Tax=Vibrio nitrifigilis TaxID=2789781 RepID=A0ABS0GGH0_9VIBR|nr:hypothetical protein [Vibrio nitrifigilis]MBF9001420.1 hypothetical protein [Vibrio nitrifigilis]
MTMYDDLQRFNSKIDGQNVSFKTFNSQDVFSVLDTSSPIFLQIKNMKNSNNELSECNNDITSITGINSEDAYIKLTSKRKASIFDSLSKNN